MAQKMLIDATHAEETRVVVVDGNKVDDFDFESLNKRQLAGNIYLAKVTRVEPSLQAAFVDYGGNRHGFLAFSEIHPDYYQIPIADREALLAEEAALDRAETEENDRPEKKPKRSRSRGRSRSAAARDESRDDAQDVVTADPEFDGSDGSGSDLVEDLPEARNHAAPAPDASGADASGAGDETGADEARADDTGAEADDAYESVAAEDVKEEIAPRRQRARSYKIQEVIKVRQILLVQVVKEERGNKGAALTTYLSLAGRYCVLMPNTARGGGISRKITNAADRKKLKEIAGEITVPRGAGLIIRTAGAKRTKTEIKRDYEYLLRQWEQIRDLTLQSVAPAHIYEEGSLIKRSIRDLYSRDIDEIFVEGERGYREAKDYMKMLMPSHAKNVRLYNEALPLFARYQVENYLSAMFNPTVQLKSGGYIVIDVTEALVAVDVNSGRSTKEGSIEDTALKTNLEAAEELARQARLRDLAGLIVIDFIDMEDRRNNAAVEKRLKDSLKTDRARIQVGRISGFGLLEMSRQRLRPGMLEASTAQCAHCHGTGRVRSDDSLGLAIMRDLEEEGVRQRTKEVLVTCPVAIANYILNAKREHVAMIESRFGIAIRIEGDPAMISPDYQLERIATPTRTVPKTAAIGAARADAMPDLEEEDDLLDTGPVEEAPERRGAEPQEAESDDQAEAARDDQPKKRRRRRRRKGGRDQNDTAEGRSDQPEGADASADTRGKDRTASEDADGQNTRADASTEEAEPEKPKRGRSRTRSRSRSKAAQTEATVEDQGEDKGEDRSQTAPHADAGADPAAAASDPRAKAVSDAPQADVQDSAPDGGANDGAPDAGTVKTDTAQTDTAQTDTAQTDSGQTDTARTDTVQTADSADTAPAAEPVNGARAETEAPAPAAKPARKPRTRVRASAKATIEAVLEQPAMAAAPAGAVPVAPSDADLPADPVPAADHVAEQVAGQVTEQVAEPVTADAGAEAPGDASDADNTDPPKRRGWWSRAIGG